MKIDHKFRRVIYGLPFTEKINFCVQLLPVVLALRRLAGFLEGGVWSVAEKYRHGFL